MQLVNSAELARIKGVSAVAVRKAVQSGRITPAKHDERGRPLFDVEPTLKAWASNNNPGQVRAHKLGGRPREDGQPNKPRADRVAEGSHHPMRPGPNGGALKTGGELRAPNMPDDPEDADDENAPSYNRAAALEKHFKAKLAKLQYEEKAGTMVKIEAVAAVVEKEYSRVRARLLAVPSKLAPEVALLDDVGTCRAMIEAAIVDALAELAADTTAKQPGAIGGGDDDAD